MTAYNLVACLFIESLLILIFYLLLFNACMCVRLHAHTRMEMHSWPFLIFTWLLFFFCSLLPSSSFGLLFVSVNFCDLRRSLNYNPCFEFSCAVCTQEWCFTFQAVDEGLDFKLPSALFCLPLCHYPDVQGGYSRSSETLLLVLLVSPVFKISQNCVLTEKKSFYFFNMVSCWNILLGGNLILCICL